MNKTIIININGIIFHIEENAYDVLRSYMTEVKRHFAYSADSDEIVTDIENRIAEMLSERLSEDKKQVVILQDVEFVTAQMGRVTDFDLQEDPEENFKANSTEPKIEKKLFRDTEDRVIGGVCSGIGHYFDVEPRLIRIAAFLLLIFGGTGFLIYIILWIVMPKAVSRTDRMAMKGEPINIQNFKKNFDEEVEAVKKNLNNAQSHAKPFIDNIGDFLNELLKHAGSFLKIVFKIIAGLIIFSCVSALVVIVIGLFALLGFADSANMHIFPFTILNPEYKSAIFFGAFILSVIPIFALILFALRVLFNKRIVTRTTVFAMLIIWIAGLCMVAYYGTKIGAQFSQEATFSQSIELAPSKVYHLQLNDKKFLSIEDSINYSLKSYKGRRRIIINNEDFNFNNPNDMRLTIERGDVDKPVLIESFGSQGESFESALRSAQQINYQFEQADSLLRFDAMVHLPKNALWRDQRVHLTLRVPENTTIMVDRKMRRYIENDNIWDCTPEDEPENYISEWTMTNSGLQCKTDSLTKGNSSHNY